MTLELLIQLLISGVGMGFIFALIAIGLALIYGVMGVINFAHGEFLMISMYATYFAFALGGIDPLVSLPFVAAAMFCFGIAVYYLLMRRVLGGAMHSQIFATFGLMVFMQAAAQFFFGADYFSIDRSLLSGVVRIGDITLPMPQLAAAAGALVCTIGLYGLVFLTGLGRSLRAVSQDRVAALTMGIDADRMNGRGPDHGDRRRPHERAGVGPRFGMRRHCRVAAFKFLLRVSAGRRRLCWLPASSSACCRSCRGSSTPRP
jgi:branched-chain amino acid transport system permease protein